MTMERPLGVVIILVLCMNNNTVLCQDNATDLGKWQISAFPNPRVDLDSCGRFGKTSWVCDPENILTKEQGKCL